MAYNQPYGYPYGMPNYNQPYTQFNNNNNYQQQPTQQTYQYAIVNGLEGAKNYQVMANQSMLLMDSNEPIAYKKSVNALGQATIEAYKLVPVNDENEKPQVEYALKSDLDKISKKIDTLCKKLAQKIENNEVENNG